ncbi:MAG: hypothetical protein AB7N80_06685 [Bdellovibrionales bacterium]
MGKWFGLLLFFVSRSVTAESALLLFKEGQPVSNYTQILDRLAQSGGKVQFSDGRNVALLRQLGAGGTTRVFLTRENTALRLAASESSHFRFLADFAAKHEELRTAGIALPKVVSVGPHFSSGMVEYVEVELLRPQVALAKWLSKVKNKKLNRPYSESDLPAEEWQALKAFARTTWKVSSILDLNAENVVLSGGRWLLQDFAGQYSLYSPPEVSRTVFSDRRWQWLSHEEWEIEDFVFATLDEAVRIERAKQGFCESFLGWNLGSTPGFLTER